MASGSDVPPVVKAWVFVGLMVLAVIGMVMDAFDGDDASEGGTSHEVQESIEPEQAPSLASLRSWMRTNFGNVGVEWHSTIRGYEAAPNTPMVVVSTDLPPGATEGRDICSGVSSWVWGSSQDYYSAVLVLAHDGSTLARRLSFNAACG